MKKKKKVLSASAPVIPKGYTGKDFNKWQMYLQRQMDKIKRTDVTAKLIANGENA